MQKYFICISILKQKTMIREIVKIDRELCNGCALCIPNCHEGALQMIDNKATLVSELMCDGLGACLGHCPVGAISIEKREAQDYSEVEVMKRVVNEGKNVVIAHLRHLDEHNETEYLRQGLQFLQANEGAFPFSTREIVRVLAEMNEPAIVETHKHTACGCPGSQERTIEPRHQMKHLNRCTLSIRLLRTLWVPMCCWLPIAAPLRMATFTRNS